MAQPSYFSDGSDSRRSDARWAILQKWLGALQDSLGGGADPSNNPAKTDTRHTLLEKINKALSP